MYIRNTAGRADKCREIEGERRELPMWLRGICASYIYSHLVNWVLIRIASRKIYILSCPFIYSLPVTNQVSHLFGMKKSWFSSFIVCVGKRALCKHSSFIEKHKENKNSIEFSWPQSPWDRNWSRIFICILSDAICVSEKKNVLSDNNHQLLTMDSIQLN